MKQVLNTLPLTGFLTYVRVCVYNITCELTSEEYQECQASRTPRMVKPGTSNFVKKSGCRDWQALTARLMRE